MDDSKRTVRGYGHLLLARYVDEQLPAEVSARIRHDLADVWVRLAHVKEDSPAPFADWEALLKALASIDEDPMARYARVQDAAKFIANHALSTWLRLLVKFLSPGIFVRKLPDLWGRDHNFGKVESRLSGPKTMIMDITGVDRYAYVAPICAGWAEAALRAMGCQDITWKENLHPPPAPQDAFDHYQVELSWR